MQSLRKYRVWKINLQERINFVPDEWHLDVDACHKVCLAFRKSGTSPK